MRNLRVWRLNHTVHSVVSINTMNTQSHLNEVSLNECEPFRCSNKKTIYFTFTCGWTINFIVEVTICPTVAIVREHTISFI